MRDLNLKHLHYFWVVAREGSIAAASERLFVTPQTISAQLKLLEEQLGQKLLQRRGTGLALTHAGETALGYADRIFDLSRELTAALAAERAGGGQIRIGIADVVPKLIASRVLLPLTDQDPPLRLVCRENDFSELVGQLAQQKLDAVISDHPATPDPNLRLYSHELGETGISFMAAPRLLGKGRRKFPDCLNQLPFLMPGHRTALRMTLESWLAERNVKVRIAGDFDDSALIKAFGQNGAGVFTCPTAIEAEVAKQYAVRSIGRADDLCERYYLITRAKQLERGLLESVLQRARTQLFAEPAS